MEIERNFLLQGSTNGPSPMAALMSVADNLASPESVPQPPNNPSPTSRSPPTTATNAQQRSASRSSQHSPNSSGKEHRLKSNIRRCLFTSGNACKYILRNVLYRCCRRVGKEVHWRLKARVVHDRNDIVGGSCRPGRWRGTSVSTNFEMHPVPGTSRRHALRTVPKCATPQILLPVQPGEHKETRRRFRGRCSTLLSTGS